MAWTSVNPVSIGNATRKSDYDKLWDNVDYFKIEHNTDGTHNGPSFNVHRNGADQTIATSSTTKVAWTTEEFDTNNNFDPSVNYRFTPTVAGKYLLSANITFNTLAENTLYMIFLYKNGASYKWASQYVGTASGIYSIGVTVVVDANGSTDYFEIYVRQESGGNRDMEGDSVASYFTGAKIIG